MTIEKKVMPTCSRCKRASVLNPCRRCATPAELQQTWIASSQGKDVEVPRYPPLPEHYQDEFPAQALRAYRERDEESKSA